MFSVGTDIIEIKRIAKAISRPGFVERVYTPYERDYIARAFQNGAERAAGIFCAKEAAAKAVGTGITDSLSFHDICITHTAQGAPQAAIRGREHMRLALSISHCRNYATATVILWEE